MNFGQELKLFSGNATPNLAKAIADQLGQTLCESEVTEFPDGETRVQIGESVRGADCFVIQSTSTPVNRNIMELMVFTDALRRASAYRINAVVPYFGYARQDKKHDAREPITAKLVANMFQVAGINRVITLDLHAGQIQGFFDVPVDHMTAMGILSERLKKEDLSNSVIVSPDVGRATEARRLANILELDLAILYKRRSSPTETAVSHVIGDVEGKRPIMIDDMISTAGTMMRAIDALVELGALPEVTLAATHPVFMEPAPERMKHEAISKVFVTDTIPLQTDNPKIEVLSTAPLLASAIKNVHENHSVSSLY